MSLRWKILAWFFVNLVVLGGALFLFLRVQFHVGIDSLLAGPTDDRLEAIARPLAAELRQQPEAQWDAALDRAVAGWRKRGLRAALYHNNGRYLAGDFRSLPPEVLQNLAQHGHRGPGGPPRGGRPPGERRRPPAGDEDEDYAPRPPKNFFDAMNSPEDVPDRPPRPPAPFPTARLEKFMLATSGPRLYWAGVTLGEMHHGPRGGPPPFPVTLLLASDSLRGGGLFFDYVPWLALGGGLLLVSVLMWLPFVHGLTRSLARMTHTAEEIAQGRFQPPPVSQRRDELGRLSRALGHMATRLEGFVSGQKRFLGDTAHELLSPLARLEVALSILEQRTGPDGDKRYTDKALDEVRHISSLVQDLLSFTKSGMRPQVAKMQSVPLAELARQVVAREAAGDKVGVDVPEDLRVCAEPELLMRALANGVRNAVRYAGDAGPITIAATPEGGPEGGVETVALTVADHGAGVPPEALDRLFDPFFRPETARTRETGGVGLGLAIVKSCVEACGGRVAVRNRVPLGLELTFTLQRAG